MVQLVTRFVEFSEQDSQRQQVGRIGIRFDGTRLIDPTFDWAIQRRR